MPTSETRKNRAPAQTLEECQRRDGVCPFSPAEMEFMRSELSARHPHLNVGVEWVDGGLLIDAQPVAA